jgi:hypothetical protein
VRERRLDQPSDEWQLDGQWYGTEAEYQAALAARDRQRERIVAYAARRGDLISAPNGFELPHVGRWTHDDGGVMVCEEHSLRYDEH